MGALMRTAVAVLAVAGWAAPDSRGCTIFMIARGGKVLVGNNEDTPVQYPAKVWFTPNRDGFLSRVCFGWDMAPGWAQWPRGE